VSVIALAGAVFGAAVGFRVWGRSRYAFSTSWWTALAYVGGGAVLGGLVALVVCRSEWSRDRTQ